MQPQELFLKKYNNYYVYLCSLQIIKKCDYCKRTPGRKLSLVRHPFPDKSRERFHYCHVNDPSVNERAVDDFQPCAQLRKLFKEGNGY